MSLLKIELLGADVLRQKAVDVPTPGPELDRLVADMFETMYEARGIGLAAPQIGLSQRLIVVDVKEDGHAPMALLNPVVAEFRGRQEKYEEGCLSIPGISGHVDRPEACVVDALDQQGNPVRIEADGMLARCLQHEIDHLDGILFLDRLSPIKRNMLLKKYRKLAKED
ncbi:peptide deformylase [Longimicrobium sp.]|uniref:peptide deformylase n=1 Tax=Longimicrobium sp. TaxID=2029185 RepID=UPI002E339594|nr:peptide deformylase [Longimicrobium sp.]HEX6041788.1 peptide deformylase [Longimicrobium sp.]